MLAFALVFAIGVVLAVALIGRLAISMWGAIAIAAMAVTLGLSAVWIRFGGAASDLAVAFADDPTSATLTKAILADSPWYGSGPRSFENLVNLYQQPANLPVTTPSSAGAKIAIELGRPMLWIAIGATLLGIVALVRAALRRGRNSFYPALGAGCLLALLIEGVANSGMFTPAVSILGPAIVGLGLAQSTGRTSR